jgi:hypothetical protein
MGQAVVLGVCKRITRSKRLASPFVKILVVLFLHMTALVEEMAQISKKSALREIGLIGEAMIFYIRVEEKPVQHSACFSHVGQREDGLTYDCCI